MKRLIVSAAILSALGLAGCGGGESIEEIQQATPVDKPFVRVSYDPANTVFSLPNDLAMTPPGDFLDMTLNTEGSATFDPANPQHALSALDGWSTHHPFFINVVLPANQGLALDPNSVAQPSAVRIFEATPVIGTGALSADCIATAAVLLAPGMPCEIGEELQWGVDFVTQATADDTITVIPMRPLKPGQGYMVAVTNSVTDNQGRGIKGSSSWELVAKDIAQYPLPLASQTLLQTIVNKMLDLMGTKGVDADSVVYSKYMSVQSVGAVMGTIKQLQIAPFATAVGGGMPIAQAAQYLPAIVAGDYKVGETVVPDLLALTQPGLSCDAIVAGVLAGDATATATFPAVAGACATDLKMGSITLPYYLSSTNPLGDYWKGACTNGVMLQLLGGEQIGGLVANGAVGPNNATCQAAGLFDLNLAAVGIDDPRNLTKFAPIPAKDSDQTLDVQITVPDATVVSMIAGAPVQMPEAGWPVVMLTHGITSKKEDMLAVAAAFAAQGYATVAIDQPLHGSRGFLIGEQIVNASTGFGGSATDYMNLSSLLSARDNVRQSSLDSLGLRLGLNALVDTTGGSIKLDTNNVHFFGHSIGAITGTNTVGVANTTLGGALANFDGMYNIKSAVLANPGGSIAAFLTESQSFGGLVNSTVASGVSPEFAAFYAGFDAAGYIGSRVGLLMAVDTTLTAEAAQAQAAAEIPTVVFETFMMRASAEGIAQVRAGISSFVFAATTILDSADPLNTARQLAASGTPVYVNLVTGDGSDENVQDATIPANLSNPAYLLSGGEPLAAIAMGLPQVTTTQPGSGYVAFSQGNHSSVAAPGTAINAEMLAQVISFIATASTGAENATVVVGGSEFIDQRTFAERRMEAQGQ